MSEALFILVGLVALSIFFFAIYTLVSHPADVDEEMTAAVAKETPEEHARATLIEHQKTDKEQSDEDGQLYGHELP